MRYLGYTTLVTILQLFVTSERKININTDNHYYLFITICLSTDDSIECAKQDNYHAMGKSKKRKATNSVATANWKGAN